jgi:Flp pilus assembly pilin Flp
MMSGIMKKLVRAAARDEGTATIELALLAPLLATMVIGVIDVSIAVGRRLEIEQAAHRSIEKQMQTTGALTVEETIRNEAICQINGQNSDGTCQAGRLAAEDVTVLYKLECIDGATVLSSQESSVSTEFEAFACANGTPTRYIEVVVEDEYDPMFNMNFGTGSDGIYQLRATAGMRVG